MKIRDVRTTLLIGPLANDASLREEGYVLPPDGPGSAS